MNIFFDWIKKKKKTTTQNLREYQVPNDIAQEVLDLLSTGSIGDRFRAWRILLDIYPEMETGRWAIDSGRGGRMLIREELPA